MKGLVDTENISHNASDYDQHLSSASPTIPPSDNETIEFGSDRESIRRRLHNHHNHHLIERRSSMTDKFEKFENESDMLLNRDDLEATERVAVRSELSPILSSRDGDQSRKRRKDSICDNPLLPQKRLHRIPSESHVSHLSISLSKSKKEGSVEMNCLIIF